MIDVLKSSEKMNPKLFSKYKLLKKHSVIFLVNSIFLNYYATAAFDFNISVAKKV